MNLLVHCFDLIVSLVTQICRIVFLQLLLELDYLEGLFDFVFLLLDYLDDGLTSHHNLVLVGCIDLAERHILLIYIDWFVHHSIYLLNFVFNLLFHVHVYEVTLLCKFCFLLFYTLGPSSIPYPALFLGLFEYLGLPGFG